jgi:hypothetical protein
LRLLCRCDSPLSSCSVERSLQVSPSGKHAGRHQLKRSGSPLNVTDERGGFISRQISSQEIERSSCHIRDQCWIEMGHMYHYIIFVLHSLMSAAAVGISFNC